MIFYRAGRFYDKAVKEKENGDVAVQHLPTENLIVKIVKREARDGSRKLKCK